MEIKQSLTGFWSYFKIGIYRHFIYRGSLWIDSISRIISIIFLVFLWATIFKTRDNIAGLTLSSLLVYYLFANIVRMLANPNIATILGEQIKSGRMQTYLIKPCHPILALAGMVVAKRLVESVIFSTISILVLYLIFPRFGLPIGEIHFGIFIPFLLLAIIIALLVGVLVGLGAFWVVNYAPLTYGLGPLTGILSGLLIPISFFPQKVQTALEFLPFKYLTSLPVLAIQGKLAINLIIRDLVLGIIWSLVLIYLIKIVWNKGVHRFDAVGN